MIQTDAVPKNRTYRTIEASLRDRIARGVWPVGSRFPSRRDLAGEYGVSLVTLERAVTSLIADGLLRADDRRGTFIARARLAPPPLSAPPSSPPPPASPLLMTATVGIVAPLYGGDEDHLKLSNFWVRLVIASLEQTFSSENIATRFFNRVPRPQGDRKLVPLADTLQEAVREKMDAIVVIGMDASPGDVDNSLAALNGHAVPVVCITTGELRRPAPHLFYDQKSGGYQAADHLLRSGKSDLVFFAPFTAYWVEERLAGVQAAVEHAQPQFTPPTVRVYPSVSRAWVMEEDPTVIGYRAAQQAFAEGVFPPGQSDKGVICVNDGVAFGFLQAAHEAGRKAGVDFALVSFDDHPDARAVGLTSLRPPMEALGQEAARLLRLSLGGGDAPSTQVRLRWNLIPRDSTRQSRPPLTDE